MTEGGREGVVSVHSSSLTETRRFGVLGDRQVRSLVRFTAPPGHTPVGYRLTAGPNAKVPLTALLGAFKNAVDISTRCLLRQWVAQPHGRAEEW